MSSVNISIARYANASASASICRTSLSLFIRPASSLILPIHNWPCTAWVPLAFDVSHLYPPQALCPALSRPLPLECLPSPSHALVPEYFTLQASLFSSSLPLALFLSLSLPVVIYMSMGQTQRLFSGLPGLNSSL